MPSLRSYFVLVTVVAVPFWVLGALVDSARFAPALFVCPAIAAVLPRPADVRNLFHRVIEFGTSPRPIWYAIAILVMPAITAITWLFGPRHGGSVNLDPLLLVLFLIAATCEELGWTAYATDPMLRRRGPLATSALLGAFWAAWHVVPVAEAHHGALWIAGWAGTAVGARFVIVWLYLRTGGAVPIAILVQAMVSVCAVVVPDYGSTQTSIALGGITILVALMLVPSLGNSVGDHPPTTPRCDM